MICVNRHKHVSGFPGYGRELCPYCRKLYVKTVARIVEERLEAERARRGS